MRIAVLGLGNVLMGDDGFGPFVIQQLQATYECPASVAVEDLGTPGLDLMPFLLDVDAVIFVDVVRSAGTPGELRVYRTDEILQHAPTHRMSPHDPGVKSALLSLRMAGVGPAEATVVGVIPASITTGPGLSDPVRIAVSYAIDAVVGELARLGVRTLPRADATNAPPWWEQPSIA